MTKQELINRNKKEIEYFKKKIKDHKKKVSYLENCYEIKKEDILRNYNEYLTLNVIEIQQPGWYFPSKPPMVKSLEITVLDGFYLSNELKRFVKFYAKELLKLDFDINV